MTTINYQSTDFQGLTPAVDPRRSQKLFALAGRNYVLDALGPKSPFGNRFLLPYPIGNPAHVQGCRLHLRGGDRSFTFTGDAIIEWNETTGGWRFIYVTGTTNAQPYRWTYGYLNGVMFFCHPVIGILAYVVGQDYCYPLTSVGVPLSPLAICVSNGRLNIINEDYATWSAPGDGTNMNPQLGGAGQQKISERIAGDPVMISDYGSGVLIWTTGGLLRGQFTGDSAVYHWRAINTELRPINSFCVFNMDDNTIVMLDERGLFKSQGDVPIPFTPIFNEFLIDYLEKYKLKLGQNVRLEWDDRKKLLYMSISLSEFSPLYERAFVLYPSIDKWGTFDEVHYGILPVLISGSSREDDYFGFIDSNARARLWNNVGSREQFPSSGTLNSVYPLFTKPAHQQLGEAILTLSSSAVANTVNDILYTQPAGFYPSSGLTPHTPDLTGLDSVLQIGYVRARGETSYDQMLEITHVFVGSVHSGPDDQTSIDFNLIPPGETPTTDQLTSALSGAVDQINYVNHGFRIIGTVDGLTMFTEDTPLLVEFNKAGRHFACSVVGIWHIIELTALEVGEAYRLQALELTGADAGKYI